MNLTVNLDWLFAFAIFYGVARGCMWVVVMLFECEHAPAPRKCELRDEERKAG